jgi:hypothetical protein
MFCYHLKFQRTDISYAIQHGRPTLFFRDRMFEIRNAFKSKGINLDQMPTASTVQKNGLDHTLHEILLDVKYLASLLNSISPGLILDTNTLLEIVISILSRLIRYHPLQDFKQISSIDAMYHIGLTIFMMTSFLQLGGRQILRYDLVALRLKEVLDGELKEADDDLVLWLMVIGGIWTSGSTNGVWLNERTRELAERMGIDTWADAVRIVDRYPWIEALHEKVGLAFWSQVCQGPDVAADIL